MPSGQPNQPKALLQSRLALAAWRLKEEAKVLPRGAEREALIKARQMETASHVNDWLSSPAVQPPK
jgi:hypothetical protein